MQNTLAEITQMKLIPVVAIQDAGHSDGLADALIAGGLPCAEITLRTAAAQDAIRNMAKRGDMLVGAGTVLTVDQAKAAIDAGATFIVAPGFNPKVVRCCQEQNIPMTPGVATPTDIEAAMEMRLEVLKFFPAEALGGIKTLKAICAPYTKAKFIPTGGINAGNVAQYLKHPNVVACGGSWMVTSALIADEQFDRITSLTHEAVTLVKNLQNENK
jgi:2-dehydro-3-deoxyphosphogluconate aldolase/(4S)-4-hydroxy-2-oxoglutarate aldolase